MKKKLMLEAAKINKVVSTKITPEPASGGDHGWIRVGGSASSASAVNQYSNYSFNTSHATINHANATSTTSSNTFNRVSASNTSSISAHFSEDGKLSGKSIASKKDKLTNANAKWSSNAHLSGANQLLTAQLQSTASSSSYSSSHADLTSDLAAANTGTVVQDAASPNSASAPSSSSSSSSSHSPMKIQSNMQQLDANKPENLTTTLHSSSSASTIMNGYGNSNNKYAKPASTSSSASSLQSSQLQSHSRSPLMFSPLDGDTHFVHINSSINHSPKILEKAALSRRGLYMHNSRTVSDYIRLLQKSFPGLNANMCKQYIYIYEKAVFSEEGASSADFVQLEGLLSDMVKAIHYKPSFGYGK
jgi:hypothetical protein